MIFPVQFRKKTGNSQDMFSNQDPAVVLLEDDVCDDKGDDEHHAEGHSKGNEQLLSIGRFLQLCLIAPFIR